MDSENRMDGCVCANGAKVAEIVHPYCPAHVPPEVRAAWSRVSRYVGHSGAHEDACDAADIVNDWLASLPGSDKEPEGFCACGRRTSECDRSRKACVSESR